MFRTLRESKAKLSELVEVASRGGEVVITVRGKPKARLVGMPAPDKDSDQDLWLDELQALREMYSTGKNTITTEQILDELREDRI